MRYSDSGGVTRETREFSAAAVRPAGLFYCHIKLYKMQRPCASRENIRERSNLESYILFSLAM